MTKKAAVSEVRAWAKQQGFDLGDRGRLPAEVWSAWDSRRTSAALPAQRTAQAAPPAATAADLEVAQDRIDRLEQQVADLVTRLNALERPAEQPRKRFARAK